MKTKKITKIGVKEAEIRGLKTTIKFLEEQIAAKEKFFNELKVGDKVLYNQYNYNGDNYLYSAKVLGLTKSEVEIEYPKKKLLRTITVSKWVDRSRVSKILSQKCCCKRGC